MLFSIVNLGFPPAKVGIGFIKAGTGFSTEHDDVKNLKLQGAPRVRFAQILTGLCMAFAKAR